MKIQTENPTIRTYSIWRSLGFEGGGAYPSPFRPDNNPSFSVFMDPINKVWKGKDFSTGKVYSADEALVLLGKEIDIKKITLTQEQKNKIKKVAESTSKIKYLVNVTELDKDMLEKYALNPKICTEEGFFSLKSGIVIKNNIARRIPTYHKTYVYKFPSGRVKFYKPNCKKYKWSGNATKMDVYGLHTRQNHTRLLITKSGKDVVFLKSLFCRLNVHIDVIAPNGEGYTIPEEYFKHLDYKEVILWYDNDEAGLKNAKKHLKYYNKFFETKMIVNPSNKPKDPTDWWEISETELIHFIKEKLKWNTYPKDGQQF